MATPQLTARLNYLQVSAHTLALSSPAISAYLLSQYHDIAFKHDLRLPDSLKRQSCHGCGGILIPGLSSHIQIENAERAGKKSSRHNHRARSGGISKAATEVKSFSEINPAVTSTASSSASQSPAASSALGLPVPKLAATTVKIMIYECQRCGRKTRFPLPIPKRIQRSRKPTTNQNIQSPSSMPLTAISDLPSFSPSSAGEDAASKATSIANSSSKKRAKARKQGGLQALLAKKRQEESAANSSNKFGLDLMDLMKSA